MEDLVVDGRIILKCILNKYGVKWINLAQNRVQLRAVMGTVTLGSHRSQGNS